MRKLLLAVALGALLSTTVGCLIPAYSGDPTRRVPSEPALAQIPRPLT